MKITKRTIADTQKRIEEARKQGDAKRVTFLEATLNIEIAEYNKNHKAQIR